MRICILLLVPFLASAQPKLKHVDVFRAGDDNYHSYRIPAIATAPDGTVLAFAEARKENRSDPGGGDIDLVVKRSTDQGATWSAVQIVDDPGVKWGASNPTPLVDRTNRRTWIFFNRWEPGFGTENSKPGTTNNQMWARYSDDNGKTWSAAVDLTRTTRDFENWGAIFLGPGGAIQTRNGRLIVPAAMRPDTMFWWMPGGRTIAMRAYAIYSDDHGATWKRGALVRAQTDENEMIELADGAVMVDARQGSGPHRWLSISKDGGVTWSNPVPGQEVTPVATAIERWTLESNGDDRNRILWTGPVGGGRRKLVARISYDEGQTFSTEKVLYGGLAAYSDLTILSDKTAGVLWERGVSDGYQSITFTRFGLDFMEK
ncbi:MAG: exo-alpha-sialidase [Bryobacteraceae bacterium]